jgi:hypothetical protein
MKIYAYGDSFVAGDQDIPGIDNSLPERIDYNRYNVSFASVLAKKLNVQLINRAWPGCGNLIQLDHLWLDSEKFQPDDLIIFGITTLWRDRFIIPIHFPEVIKRQGSGSAILNQYEFKDDQERIAIADFFYILSTIEKLEEICKVRIIKFNLFHNIFDKISEEDRKKFQFDNFIDLHQPGNTLLDVLTDNWGNNIPRISNHSKWKPEVNQHLFTRKSHPSIAGHIKIAEWLHQKLIDNNWL